jgi:hypothetical protein
MGQGLRPFKNVSSNGPRNCRWIPALPLASPLGCAGEGRECGFLCGKPHRVQCANQHHGEARSGLGHVWRRALRALDPWRFLPCHSSLNLSVASRLLLMTRAEGLGTTPLKPKQGLNGAPSGFVAGAVSTVTPPSTCRRQVDCSGNQYPLLPGWAGFHNSRRLDKQGSGCPPVFCKVR